MVVEQSVQNDLIPNSLIASDDGTCIITGASPLWEENLQVKPKRQVRLTGEVAGSHVGRGSCGF